MKSKEKNENYKPCRICQKENKGLRYHPETLCWYKNNEKEKNAENKNINSSELQVELSNKEPKNL